MAKSKKSKTHKSTAKTYPYFETYQDAAGEWRWRISAKNGLTVADSAEGYSSKSAMMKEVKKLNEVADWPLRVEEEAVAETPTSVTSGGTVQNTVPMYGNGNTA